MTDDGPRTAAADRGRARAGADFRPDYLRPSAAADAFGRPPILALTATAAPPVRDDIVARLGMTDPATTS
jgi:superfamily II DNA helicase RecQ